MIGAQAGVTLSLVKFRLIRSAIELPPGASRRRDSPPSPPQAERGGVIRASAQHPQLAVKVFLIQIGAAQPAKALERPPAVQGAPIVEKQHGSRRQSHRDLIGRVIDEPVEQLQGRVKQLHSRRRQTKRRPIVIIVRDLGQIAVAIQADHRMFGPQMDAVAEIVGRNLDRAQDVECGPVGAANLLGHLESVDERALPAACRRISGNETSESRGNRCCRCRRCADRSPPRYRRCP